MMRMKIAADEVVAAALAGDTWEGPLERLALACGARDAVLMRNSPTRMMVAVATQEAAESVAAFAAGKSPPNSRYARVRATITDGFRIDHDDYNDAELAKDPFYQEFLRPAGIFWHANAILGSADGDEIELSFKRRASLGPYSRRDVRALNTVLPQLRSASRIAQQRLNAEAQGISIALGKGSLAVFQVDRWGRVVNPIDPDPGHGSPVAIVGRRLVASNPDEQRRLDAALATALNADSGMALAALTAPDGRRYFLQVHAIPSRTQDLFLSASAIAVLIARDRAPGYSRTQSKAIGSLFGLTDREAEVACMRAEGLELTAIAALLGISADTVRTYLKFAYDKMGVRRQAELVALIARLLP